MEQVEVATDAQAKLIRAMDPAAKQIGRVRDIETLVISDTGNLYRLTRDGGVRRLRPWKDSKGYLVMDLYQMRV